MGVGENGQYRFGSSPTPQSLWCKYNVSTSQIRRNLTPKVDTPARPRRDATDPVTGGRSPLVREIGPETMDSNRTGCNADGGREMNGSDGPPLFEVADQLWILLRPVLAVMGLLTQMPPGLL